MLRSSQVLLHFEKNIYITVKSSATEVPAMKVNVLVRNIILPYIDSMAFRNPCYLFVLVTNLFEM